MRGLVSLAGQHTAVGIQRYCYGRMAQKLVEELAVNVVSQKQCGSGVPEVVKTGVGETDLLQERSSANADRRG